MMLGKTISMFLATVLIASSFALTNVNAQTEIQKISAEDAIQDVTACEWEVDLESLQEVIIQASNWVDIEEVTLETDASTLRGSIKVSGPISEKRTSSGQDDAIVAHMAIDTDRDGRVDYGIDIGKKSGSDVSDLLTDYRFKTSSGQGEIEEFPGKVSMTSSSFAFEIPLSAIDGATSFDWFVLVYWVLSEGPIDKPDVMMLQLSDIYPDDMECPFNSEDSFEGFPNRSEELIEKPTVSIATKHNKKITLVSVRNNYETPIYGLELKSADGSIKFVKARGWDREKIDASTVLIQTDDIPLTKNEDMIVLLILDNKDSELEWRAFDADGVAISSDVLSHV